MPQRMVKTLEDEMALKGAVPVSEVERARNAIMDQVRELAENGEIDLQLYQEMYEKRKNLADLNTYFSIMKEI